MSSHSWSLRHPGSASPDTRERRSPGWIEAGQGLRTDLRASVGDGVTYSLMVGMGETYLPAFVLALGMGEIASGLISTLPLLAGALLQLITPWAVGRLGSRRAWVVGCARCQSASLLLLVLLPAAGPHLAWLVFAAVSLYWGAGLAVGPVWNTWMEDVVPKRIRPRFFAGRVRLSQASIMLAFVLGGLVLDQTSGSPSAIWAFALLFALAATSRLASSCFLASQREPRCRHGAGTEGDASLRETMRRLRGNSGSRLLFYFVLVQVAVYTSSPYFAPFMLSEMGMTYTHYMVLIAFGYLGKVLALPVWGKYATRYGSARLLWLGALGIVPMSGLWLVSQSFWYLAALQVTSGVLWAAYELAMALLFFEAIPRNQRTSLLTLYNVGNSSAMVLGGLVGALFLTCFGEALAVYFALFLASSIARALTLGLLPWVAPRSPQPAPAAVSALPASSVPAAAEQRILAALRTRRIDAQVNRVGTTALEAPSATPAGAASCRDALAG